MSDIPIDRYATAKKIERQLALRRMKQELSRQERQSKAPPLRNVRWDVSSQSWVVEIKRAGRVLIRRSYKSQEDAIAARDYTLAHGEPPPR